MYREKHVGGNEWVAPSQQWVQTVDFGLNYQPFFFKKWQLFQNFRIWISEKKKSLTKQVSHDEGGRELEAFRENSYGLVTDEFIEENRWEGAEEVAV